MRTGRVSFSNLARQLVPPHKRQEVRLWLLRHWMRPLEELFEETDLWRSRTRMELNVTSQVKVLEGYLRRKYNEPFDIHLYSFSNLAVQVGLRHEGRTHRMQVGLRGQEVSRTAVPMGGEIRATFGDADFIVYIPERVDIESVRADIERFKQALVKYRIMIKD